ncbi:polyphenol oxidase [Paraliobacillus ryukyuensis]|uniref:Purine nucleoside phosphorylase n=1 Tax=Paraliobacillus ryukyuensis TaxID=200904 RepID=A0A366EIQ3_9BACI|nr:peptidoglycan editing factor PgeF [Paraliobacillus ryukyuensis]RBP01876.1 hypothetical protein DES48_101623 [Paraliobacillus ryukyuensis]
MEPFIQDHSSMLEIEAWKKQQHDLYVGITTRDGGISKPPYDSFNLGLHVNDCKQDVLVNRSHLATLLGFPLTNWVMGEQTHGTSIHLVTTNDKGKGATDHLTTLAGVDGLITKENNVLLTAMFADCVPLYFWDKETNWIGIAHAGWRGTVQQMAGKMVDALQRSGANIATLQVAIGPAISYQYYEIDQRVYDQIPLSLRDQVTSKTNESHYFLDLSTLHREILLEKGIHSEHIYQTNYCTYHDDKFFSHRREGGKTGRMLGFIGRK